MTKHVLLTKQWEFEIPDDIEDYCIHDERVYYGTSRYAAKSWRYCVGSYLVDTESTCWSKTIDCVKPSWNMPCTLFNERFVCAINGTALHFDCISGEEMFRFKFSDSSEGPVIIHNGNIISSCSKGQVTVYNLKENSRIQPLRVASRFHYAVVRGNKLYVLTWRKERKGFLFGKRSVPQVESVVLDDFNRDVVLDLDGSERIDGMCPTESGVLIAEGSTISLLSSSSKRIWSRSVGPVLERAIFNFHGAYGSRLLVSVDGWLNLIEAATGNLLWEHQLDNISDALLLEDDSVVFSTCGGGWSMLPFNDPGNCVGRFVPGTSTVDLVYRMPWTANVHLKRIGDTIVASSAIRKSKRGQSRLVGFAI